MHRRNTKAKRLILESLKNARSAVSHENLQEELGDAVDRATIYRALNSFCDDGIAHKIVGDDGKQYFAFCLNCTESRHNHRHFHFRCIGCRKVECLPSEIDFNLPAGYRSVNFNGVISGYCSGCSLG